MQPAEHRLAGSLEELVQAFRAIACEVIVQVQMHLNPAPQAGHEALAPRLELLDRG